MGSERLPGKVLADLCGTPVLAWLLDRLGRSERAGLMVATTTEPGDDAVAELCEERDVDVFRGHPTDVLARFSAAVEWAGAETIARVSADSPFVDHRVADTVIDAFESGEVDIAQNHRPAGWPLGTAVEVFSRPCLTRLDREARDPRHREHVTLYAYENPDDFRIRHVPPPAAVKAPELRICLDTAEDLERLRGICAALGGGREFSLDEVVALENRAEPAR